MMLPFVFPPKDKYPLFFNSFLVFLDLQLLLLFHHGFSPGDDIFCGFFGERAGDGVVVPVAKGSLHLVPCSALLSLPPPPYHGICALAIFILPRTTRFFLALKNPSDRGADSSKVTGWDGHRRTHDGILTFQFSTVPLSFRPALVFA